MNIKEADLFIDSIRGLSVPEQTKRKKKIKDFFYDLTSTCFPKNTKIQDFTEEGECFYFLVQNIKIFSYTDERTGNNRNNVIIFQSTIDTVNDPLTWNINRFFIKDLTASLFIEAIDKVVQLNEASKIEAKDKKVRNQELKKQREELLEVFSVSKNQVGDNVDIHIGRDNTITLNVKIESINELRTYLEKLKVNP